jgi:hypothetical protein
MNYLHSFTKNSDIFQADFKATGASEWDDDLDVESDIEDEDFDDLEF